MLLPAKQEGAPRGITSEIKKTVDTVIRATIKVVKAATMAASSMEMATTREITKHVKSWQNGKNFKI